MRKLASIQRVTEVRPIEGADAIEVARVLGWNVVIKRGEFKPGDLCVYVEIDSLLPDRPEFEFLRPKGFRIRTIKLRGQVSQGICFPLSIIADAQRAAYGAWTPMVISEGDDVTDLIGIVKYEPPIPAQLAGKVKGLFPSFLEKTDETRVQVLGNVLERHKGKRFYRAEKLDGSSFTTYIRNGQFGDFGICSRNLELAPDPSNTFWAVADEMDLEQKMRDMSAATGLNFSLQGELIGPGIQGNKYGLKKHEIRFFNVYNIDTATYLSYKEFIKFIEILGFKTVPIDDDDFILDHSIDELVELSKGNSSLNPKVKREGDVIRPINEENDPDLGRLSFKVINPEFLLKYNDD